MEEQRTFEIDGRTVTFYGTAAFVYLDSQPCIRHRLRGDIELALGDDTLMKAEEHTDGTTAIWYVPCDPGTAQRMRELCALYAGKNNA